MAYWKLNITPRSVHKDLNEYVIGQESAKTALSIAIYNHFARCNANLDAEGTGWLAETVVEKMNVLFLGPSGAGKTHMVQTAARKFNAPFTMIDATKVTPAGWVGKNAEDICQQLVDAADGNVLKAEMGIVLIDEVCKICAKSREDTSDMNGTGVQKAFLKLLEGTRANVSVKDAEGNVRTHVMRTHNILFVLAGAFEGMAEIIQKRRRNGAPSIGFGATLNEKSPDLSLLQYVEDEDLLAYGFIREFIGRIPIRVALEKLTVEQFKLILTKAKHNLIDQYRVLLKPHIATLTFTPEAIEEIARIAFQKSTGARALAQVLSKVMAPINYALEPHNCTVTRAHVLGAMGLPVEEAEVSASATASPAKAERRTAPARDGGREAVRAGTA